MGTIGGFDPASARRIAEAVRRVERAPRNAEPPRRQFPGPMFQGLIPVLATSGFTAGSYSSPSSNTCTLLQPVDATGAGLQAATGTDATVTVKNPYAKAVTGTNKLAWVTPYNGQLYLVTCDC